MTLFTHAQRYVGEVQERPGEKDHPLIVWWLSLCRMGFDAHDEVPWCSGFVNGMAWDLRLPRTKSAAARSWLAIGTAVVPEFAKAEADVVILKRGGGNQPGPDVLAAPGHVGLFAGLEGTTVLVLGGNQGNGVTIARFSRDQVLGIRRLV